MPAYVNLTGRYLDICTYLTRYHLLLQRRCLSRFSLHMVLRVAHRHRAVLVACWASQIESCAKLLTGAGVAINITIQSARDTPNPVPLVILQSLAPYLSSISLYSVPTELVTRPWPGLCAAHSGFTATHVAALRRCDARLSTLCVSEIPTPLALPPDSIANSMADIAQLAGLAKLHLTFALTHLHLDFQPLSQLTTLTDLALQCYLNSASCVGVLDSNKQGLQHVILAAGSWSDDTYVALQQIPHLGTLTLKVWMLSSAQAHALNGVTASHTHLDLHQVRHLPGNPLLALSTAAIHQLTLWNVDDVSCQQLGSMPSLETLTIANSPLMTGTSFNTYGNMTELTFMNCPGIGPAGLQHIISAAMPALERFAIQCWGNYNFANTQLASGISALSRGTRLVDIDLRGLQLRYRHEEELQRSIEARQSCGATEPIVTLHLPVHSFSLPPCQILGAVVESLHMPPFLRVMGLFQRESRKVVCKHKTLRQQTLQQVGDGVRVLFIMDCVTWFQKSLSARRERS